MFDPNYLCAGCMRILENKDDVCPNCGFEEKSYLETISTRALRPGTILAGKYLIGKVLGEGGFGITYLGWDLNLELKIAIKEYFPVGLATRDMRNKDSVLFSVAAGDKRKFYETGLKNFATEARNLAKFQNVPGVVSVKDFFFENQTAYLVMEYLEGMNLKQYLKVQKAEFISERETLNIMRPVIEALIKIHSTGIVHRDISPENIILTTGGEVKLIDFGAARMATGAETQSLTVLLKHGYAPMEQYQTKGNQGPWTDVYALCATMYRLLSGKVPQEAIDRIVGDKVESLCELSEKNPKLHVSKRVSDAIQKGLAVNGKDRYQSVEELRNILYPVLKENPPTTSDKKQTKNNKKGMKESSVLNTDKQSEQVAKSKKKNTEEIKERKKADNRNIVFIVIILALCFVIAGVADQIGKETKKQGVKVENNTDETLLTNEQKTPEVLKIGEDVILSRNLYPGNEDVVYVNDVMDILQANDGELSFGDVPIVEKEDTWKRFYDTKRMISLEVNREGQCGNFIGWKQYPYLSVYGITCGMSKEEIDIILNSDKYDCKADETDENWYIYSPQDGNEEQFYIIEICYYDDQAEEINVMTDEYKLYSWLDTVEGNDNENDSADEDVDNPKILEVGETLPISRNYFFENQELVRIVDVINTLVNNDKSLMFYIPSVVDEDDIMSFYDENYNIWLTVDYHGYCGETIGWENYPYLSVYGITCGMAKNKVEEILDSEKYEYRVDEWDKNYVIYYPRGFDSLFEICIQYLDNKVSSIQVLS